MTHDVRCYPSIHANRPGRIRLPPPGPLPRPGDVMTLGLGVWAATWVALWGLGITDAFWGAFWSAVTAIAVAWLTQHYGWKAAGLAHDAEKEQLRANLERYRAQERQSNEPRDPQERRFP